MSKALRILFLCLLCCTWASTAAAQSVWQNPDPVTVDRFNDEAMRRSQIMDVISYLTDVYGPRLTNSPNIREAAAYVEKTLNSWGLSNVREEKWGPFGTGWSNELFEASEIAPRHFPLIAYPKAWTSGTKGPITADVVYAKIANKDDFEAYRGKLKGKIVMTAPARLPEAHFSPQARRFTEQELAALIPALPQPPPLDDVARARLRTQQEFAERLQRFVVDEGALAWLEPSPLDGGTIVVTSGGSRDPKDKPMVLRVAMAGEQYGRIQRTLEKNVPVTLRMNAVNKFYDDSLDSFNVIAELPGTDKADEVVMLGAHLDSWDSGPGATDNAVGCAVMMEVMRILKSSGLSMRRTVRLALWTGEEEGLLGSRAYVKEHFAEVPKMRLKPDYPKLSAYYNLDNGTGKIRGIYLQNSPELQPIFGKWIAPFDSMGVTTLSNRSPGGSDHVSFAEAGLPGLLFIQDPIEYETRTHHTNMDVFERVQEADAKQAAAVIATMVYMTANADELLPRKPLEKH